MINYGQIGTYVGENSEWLGVRVRIADFPIFSDRMFTGVILSEPPTGYHVVKGGSGNFQIKDFSFKSAGFGQWFKKHS